MVGYRLPKWRLLRKKQEFDAVYREGSRLYGVGVTLVFRANDRGFSRIGISVNRKIKGAVTRNRIKRICRESFRLNPESFPAQADIVIAVRPDFSLQSPAQVTRVVNDLVYRAHTTK
ncbi:MAG: ribonuclease P protein component [Desulfofustis sp. PB-SRB1]|nr:ribonuclease P protein component [Desulfofustis sp. PB-SRB1]MBM1001314.1 ribonuclease P protein component [Desulfofustis sp. PB-SRB1]HBH28925.1 ribonuclease P protein component [Desulfofustis sp.]HBH30380.1 ribonuclease P protein component [Desulfofustis sp.]